jgi:hypothetical protein
MAKGCAPIATTTLMLLSALGGCELALGLPGLTDLPPDGSVGEAGADAMSGGDTGMAGRDVATTEGDSGPDAASRDGGVEGGLDASTDGTAADAGNVCVIDGTTYPANQPNPTNICQVCRPATSTTGWSDVPDEQACGSGACCSGGCVQESTDPNNCGFCGRSCGGAACTGGLCPISTLASSLNAPSCMTLNETGVYFTVGTGVAVVPLDGGSTTQLASDPNVPTGIATSSTDVYWTDFSTGTIFYRALTSPAVTELDAGQAVQFCGFAVDSTSAYCANRITAGDGGDTVTKVALGDASVTTLASQESSVRKIALDSTNVYFTAEGTAANGFMDGAVVRVPRAGGTPTTLASAQWGVYDVAVDSTSVYWTDAYGGTVMKVATTGGTAVTLVNLGPTNTPWAIAVDATGVYFTDTQTDTVSRVALDGGKVTTLATSQFDPVGIGDPTAVYWLDVGDTGTAPDGALTNEGSLMKVPK